MASARQPAIGALTVRPPAGHPDLGLRARVVGYKHGLDRPEKIMRRRLFSCSVLKAQYEVHRSAKLAAGTCRTIVFWLLGRNNLIETRKARDVSADTRNAQSVRKVFSDPACGHRRGSPVPARSLGTSNSQNWDRPKTQHV
ncbi:hypothetical protein MAPG_07915 [Magnaporthiopsis poae ATCC 64411]|uniref:Uncharacterized protein n=1 Tax=Magnaporthiopsis poae (strain ATCC 64411 / 73-15) TaxID=644358 RepID=A0A0C4E5Y6_MAGP6|nr:hypothetical protein MAPG_07915 [Magnaporthiopsis poae ATCC 64411]